MRIEKKQVLLLLLIAVVFLAVGCGGSGSELSAVNAEVYEETRTLENGVTVELSYPMISAETEEASAKQVIEKLNEQFKENAENFIQQVDAEYPAVATYNAEVLYNEKGQLSVMEMLNFGNQEYRQYAATYSLADGEKMTLGEVMNMDQSKAESTVIQQFGGVIQSDPATFHADAATYVQEHLDLMQYYRYSEGLGVFFQAGEIAPASMGILEMVIQ